MKRVSRRKQIAKKVKERNTKRARFKLKHKNLPPTRQAAREAKNDFFNF